MMGYPKLEFHFSGRLKTLVLTHRTLVLLCLTMSIALSACKSENQEVTKKKVPSLLFVPNNFHRVSKKNRSSHNPPSKKSSAPSEPHHDDNFDEYTLRIAFDESKLLNPAQRFATYNEVLESGILGKTLWDIIANKGMSKNYHDLLPLDGGTVGIAHFASGGLEELYRHMDTQHYFGLSQDVMVKKYSKNCHELSRLRKTTGCYGMEFWRVGMRNFLNSSESEKIQKKTFLAKNRKLILKALNKGWRSPKEIMIAISIANSLGYEGFQELASAGHWHADQILQKYSKLSDHKERRADLIIAYFDNLNSEFENSTYQSLSL
jgi:hypothetical protein